MASKLPTVALIGQANVGKSSLFNRMVRAQQAIVAREAGTTRDSVIGKVEYKKHQFWLVDTAGLKDPNDDFEATIQDQITEASESADVILVVVDSIMYPSDQDKIIQTSAEHNRGIANLLDMVTEKIPAKIERQQNDILRVALIGRPNVGKSTLFNALAGKQQALVANIAGTTRDINRVQVRYNQNTIELLDTAGIRRQGKQETGIEKFSVLRTLQAIEESDICLLLLDVNELNVALDQRLAGIINDAGKGLIVVVSKWDSVEGKDAFTRDALAPKISYHLKFVPWAPLIFTSSITGQNITKLFDLVLDINKRRNQETKTRTLNDLLQKAVQKHPPAGLKNTHPKLRYIVQTDTTPPWFVIYGSNLKFIHWSYKRYLESLIRDTYNYNGTPIKLSFRDEKQIKSNKKRISQGKEPVTKAYKQAKNAEKLLNPNNNR